MSGKAKFFTALGVSLALGLAVFLTGLCLNLITFKDTTDFGLKFLTYFLMVDGAIVFFAVFNYISANTSFFSWTLNLFLFVCVAPFAKGFSALADSDINFFAKILGAILVLAVVLFIVEIGIVVSVAAFVILSIGFFPVSLVRDIQEC